MRNSQLVLEIAQENGSVVRIDRSTCLDFVYFQDVLTKSRRPDDNITHRINKIDPADPKQCQQLYDMMRSLHIQRAQSLSFCMDILKEKIEGLTDDPEIKLHKREVSSRIRSDFN